MVKTTKKKAPSRVRYEQAHPTVSCRISKEVYERLQSVKKAQGKSFTDILKIGLGILEVQVKDEEELRKKGYAEGYRKGYAMAERLYKVIYLCAICKKPLVVTTTAEKEAIKKYMQEYGWVHTACKERKR